ncbi:MFS transporter [Serratia fonticola]|uniref:MFS transporter n=1 Tax=Serratia fonticola TaxID=47917 RepID=UPI002178EC39|nr:MFS transporter [Serratia fonticola]CAI0962626.1 Inner membrane transport protein ydhC [Serratia fonticola]CAI1077000.1 Inner membrane transport protein ydhC [Serratia fonticola]
MSIKNLPLPLIIVMIMAPQILETLYSPALTAIRFDYQIDATQASHTLSVYFFAFAFGVAFWGMISDQYGRRTAMLAGLVLYTAGALLALLSNSFTLLIVSRAIIAFGAAVGSVVTQTMLRDVYQGQALGKMFAIIGMALSISPVVGMFSGGMLVFWGGRMAIFSAQAGLALLLLIWCWRALPETRQQTAGIALLPCLQEMLRDRQIWCSALLVASFNIMAFSYFSLAPFIFQTLGLTSEQFGYSGIVLAFGSLCGAAANRYLLQKGLCAYRQIQIASLLALLAAVAAWYWQASLMILLPCMMVTVAFGLAIPNILSQALKHYRNRLGAAGAILGLLYYLLIAGGLALAAMGQHLPLTLLGCSLLSLACSARLKGYAER